MAFLSTFFKLKKDVPVTDIRPWDAQQMTTLTRHLGISPNELKDAILETGSLDLRYIKAYMKRKKEQLLLIKRLSSMIRPDSHY